MKKLLFNLQMFADGGDGGAGAASDGIAGSEIAGSDGAKVAKHGRSNPLESVIYGKVDAKEESAADSNEADSKASQKSKSQSFEDMIKGEYKEEFQKRTQSIIDKRFKETRGLQEQLASYDPILNMLSEKYGVDSKDVQSLLSAIENDDSFYEQEALDKGLSVKQLKEIKTMERENAELKRAAEEQQARENGEKIYQKWLSEAEALQQKYGLENFSIQDELENPDFVNLLRNNVSFEGAYMALHMDEMISGAMAKTASAVKSDLAKSIASRQARPSENGLSTSNSSQIFKTDVNSLTKKDRDEIDRRVMRGAIISF